MYLSTHGQFLKLSLHKCHLNRHNMYNQAGIIAINVLGFPLKKTMPFESQGDAVARPSFSVDAGKVKVPPLEDLAFDMNFDPITAATIRKVNQHKEDAVNREEYELAKRLKNLETHLKAQGAQLAKLESEKRLAVQQEDYDRAQVIKHEIGRIRASIDDELTKIVPTTAPVVAHEEVDSRQPRVPAPVQHSIKSNQPVTEDPIYYNGPPSPTEPILSVPMDDERPIPTLANSSPRPGMEEEEETKYAEDAEVTGDPVHMDVVIEALDGISGLEELPEADEIPIAMKTEAAELAQVFHDYLVRCLYSAHVRLRTAALAKLEHDLEGERFDLDDIQQFSKLCSVIRDTSTDKVANVYISSVRLLETVVDRVSKSTVLERHSVLENIEGIIPAIVEKLGDNGARVRESSCNLLIQLAQSDFVGPSVIAGFLIKHSRPGKTMLWRPLLARLRLTKELIETYGLSKLNIPMERVMALITSNNGHQHPNGKVRDASKDLTIELYKLDQAFVLPFLKDFRKKQTEEYYAAFSQADKDLGRQPMYDHQSTAPDPITKKEKRLSPRSEKKSKPSSARREESPRGDREVNININVNTSPTNAGNVAANETEENVQGEDDYGPPFTCHFCDRYDESFTDEKLDLHYWRECPMLTSCSRCQQIIEVATLNDHLLNECSQKSNHQQCGRCGEAIASKFYKMHVKRNSCLVKEPLSKASRCPLCHKNIGPGEEGWKKHLLTGKGCPKNERTRHLR